MILKVRSGLNELSYIALRLLENCEIVYNFYLDPNSTNGSLLKNTKIKELYLTDGCSYTIDFSQPDNLEVAANYVFEDEIDSNLPKTLKKFSLKINNYFVDLRNYTNLTHIYFENFDQSIANILPPNLIHISFGNMFNTKIEEGELPLSVVSVVFGKKFIRSIENSFHNNIKSIHFYELFTNELVHIPINIEVLKLHRIIEQNNLNDFIYFPNLKHLEINYSRNCLNINQLSDKLEVFKCPIIVNISCLLR